MAAVILAGFKARGTSIPAVCAWSEATQFQAQVTSNAKAGQKSHSPKGRSIFGTFRRCSSFTLLKQCAIVAPRTVLKSGPSIVKLWLGHYTSESPCLFLDVLVYSAESVKNAAAFGIIAAGVEKWVFLRPAH